MMPDNAAQSTSTTDSSPIVLFFGRDIFFAPVVKNAANTAGCRLQILLNVDSLKAAIQSQALDTKLVRACVLDLTPLSAQEISVWGAELAVHLPTSKRIAFGPHIQTEHFQAATQAGFAPVMAKGQVAAALAGLL